MSDDLCELLAWDTEFFGFPVARLKSGTLTRTHWPAVEQWCRARGVRCLYCFLRPDFRSTRVVEAAGGNLVDTRTTYEWRASSSPSPPVAPPTVRVATAADMPALERIAGSSHHGRFHVDDHFPREAADELYRIWIRKGRHERKDHILVGDDESGRAQGYCACGMKDRPSGERAGVIELIAVDEAARGHGLGKDLLAAALAYFLDNGVATVHLVTQAQNLPAQRLYQRFGFLVTGCQFTYHKWFDGGGGGVQ